MWRLHDHILSKDPTKWPLAKQLSASSVTHNSWVASWLFYSLTYWHFSRKSAWTLIGKFMYYDKVVKVTWYQYHIQGFIHPFIPFIHSWWKFGSLTLDNLGFSKKKSKGGERDPYSLFILALLPSDLPQANGKGSIFRYATVVGILFDPHISICVSL